ncbi:MAG: AAA domain protein [Podoviridae sp. ctda_1]|nr:MAG: AAA domain protein [Podoviridae sp. ctda_1]
MFQDVKTLALNEGQEKAADAFFAFLMSDQREMIVSGAGGTGKTHLMGYMVDTIMPRYEKMCELVNKKQKYHDVVMTATTNKAAEVLGNSTGRPTGTIHSYLNLKLSEDFSTGVSKLERSKSWKMHSGDVVFVDEASMVNAALHRCIGEANLDCKIVYVGDHCQLAAVGESKPNVFTLGLQQANLTEQMRNSGNPALMNLCNQLRRTVETGVFEPIEIVPGSIDHLSGAAMQHMVDTTFIDPEVDSRILAFTNDRVNQYNGHIRNLRGLPATFTVGEHLVVNKAYQHAPTVMVSTESEVRIIELYPETTFVEVDNDHPDVKLEIQYAAIEDQFGKVLTNVPIIQDTVHRARLMSYFKSTKQWRKYYNLQNNFPDLRQRDASTTHKAQGQTFDTAFIDLTDISRCPNPSMAARLLYVAFSRARHRVFCYGELAPRFGGLKFP